MQAGLWSQEAPGGEMHWVFHLIDVLEVCFSVSELFPKLLTLPPTPVQARFWGSLLACGYLFRNSHLRMVLHPLFAPSLPPIVSLCVRKTLAPVGQNERKNKEAKTAFYGWSKNVSNNPKGVIHSLFLVPGTLSEHESHEPPTCPQENKLCIILSRFDNKQFLRRRRALSWGIAIHFYAQKSPSTSLFSKCEH